MSNILCQESWRCEHNLILSTYSSILNLLLTTYSSTYSSTPRSSPHIAIPAIMSQDRPIALGDFPADAYFDKHKPSTWQLGAFSNYCYQLPGFPSTDRKKRKRAAFNLWQQALQHISETNDAEKRDVALKLMKVSIPLGLPPICAILGQHDHSSCTRLSWTDRIIS